jgi:6-phosphofructokinase 2
MSEPIVTLTMNPAVDESTRVASVVPERKLRCAAPSYQPGGGGINVARAVHTLGGETLAWYVAGGPGGQLLDDLLSEEGVPHEGFAADGWTRINLIVAEESSDQQYRFGLPGAEVSEAQWRACLDHLRAMAPPPYLVASGSLPPGVPDDFFAQLARIAKDRGIRVIIDTSGEPLRQAAEEGVFLLKPNARELSEITGREFADEAEQEQLAREVLGEAACEAVVLSLGAAGVLLVTGDHTDRIRAPSVPIRSKVGAGDSTVAGIVTALSRDYPLPQAVRFGVAAGAAAVMTPGTELCRREDTERLYEQLRDGWTDEAEPAG